MRVESQLASPDGRNRTVLRWTIAAIVLVAMLAAVAPMITTGSPAFAQTREQRQLEQAKARLDQVRDALEEAEAEAEVTQRAFEDAEATLREMEQIVNETTEAVESQRMATSQARSRLESLERDRDELVHAFNRRTIRAFKLGPTTTIDLLLAGEDAADAIARSAYLERVLEGDQIDLQMIEAASTAVAAERELAEAEQQRLEALLTEREQILDEVEELRAMRALEAADARERVATLRAQQDDLEAEQDRIEELIAEREAEARRQAQAARSSRSTRTASPPASSSGGYSWPLCAPVTSEYGPRWGRMHRGIDLGAPTGTPIGAAREGQVTFAGWQGGYGRLVLIRHAGGIVTAYAHMNSFSVSPGTHVSRGQTIGTIGSTGNSTGPHLHLEFRVGGQAQNPRQFLSGSPC